MAATKRLTDTAARQLKPGEKIRKVTDGDGLQLLVMPTGSKRWQFAYRFHGSQRSISLGPYPLISLAEARDKRDAFRRALLDGKDPARVQREARRASAVAAETFASVAKRWYKSRVNGWTPAYASRVWSRVQDDLNSHFGSLAIEEVDSTDVLKALRRIEARGAFETAKRVKQYADDIFRFARAERLVKYIPTEELHRALAKNPPKKHRKALKPAQMPELLTRLAVYDGRPLTRLALRLTLLTMVRTAETRFAQWDEFEDLEGAEPLWRVPAERMKMRHEHLVPLSTQAVEVLREIRALGLKSPFVFPKATRSRVISENTMLYALYRMGFHGRASVHGFRGTASTVLNENDFNRDWVERQLAHAEQDEVRAAYNAAEWLPQRRKMLQWWADWLDTQAARGLGGAPQLVVVAGEDRAGA